MAPQTYKQMRCSHGYSGQCKRAGGYAFLVLDHLPWTLIGMCRKCAEEVRKDLIYEAAQAASRRCALIASEAAGVQLLQLRGAEPPMGDEHSAGAVEQICAIADQEGVQKHCTPIERQLPRVPFGETTPPVGEAEIHPKLDASQPASCGSGQVFNVNPPLEHCEVTVRALPMR